ncbi:MAG: DNA alkylation repair protein [Bacteroidetes bacterium]|nr:DNA alkylation repair protein [Bacteroidota bacterium]
MVEESIQKILNIENGFKEIEAEATVIFKKTSIPSIFALSTSLLLNDAYQVRSLAVFLLGNVASAEQGALEIIRDQARKDGNWRVQEVVAKAFDKYCQDKGYETALADIEDWLSDPHPNVCRAVTEGLRIWTGRPYFKTHPEIAIRLISHHKANPSEYLRKSVGNALRDISRKFPELVLAETTNWEKKNPLITLTLKHVLHR